jgi:predicted MFS family arabinose efflux permease
LIGAVGAISTFIGVAATTHITRHIGPGPAMILGLGVFGVSLFFIPMASGTTAASALLLVIQQIGDGFHVLYDINQVSIRQTTTSEGLLGRVNATMQFLGLGTTLLGSLLGGVLSGGLGVRLVLVLGGCGTLLATLALAASPLRKFTGGPVLTQRGSLRPL